MYLKKAYDIKVPFNFNLYKLNQIPNNTAKFLDRRNPVVIQKGLIKSLNTILMTL